MTRTYGFRNYKNCWLGTEFVKWLTKNKGWDEETATYFGHILMHKGYVVHVAGTQQFHNRELFYKFISKTSQKALREKSKFPSMTDVERGKLKELKDVVTLLQTIDHGIKVKDRTWRLKKYKDCFIANELITWLVKNLRLNTRVEAIAWAREIQEMGIIDHVTYNGKRFEDSFLFYRFIYFLPMELAPNKKLKSQLINSPILPHVPLQKSHCEEWCKILEKRDYTYHKFNLPSMLGQKFYSHKKTILVDVGNIIVTYSNTGKLLNFIVLKRLFSKLLSHVD